MNPQQTDPLANLRPMHLPDAVSWWPPAPGWWVLAALALMALCLLGWWLLRRWRKLAFRREAVKELDQLLECYQTDGDNRAFVQAVNALIKRTALASEDRQRVSGLSGDAWLNFLQNNGGAALVAPGVRELLEDCYAPQIEGDCEPLAVACKKWLESRR